MRVPALLAAATLLLAGCGVPPTAPTRADAPHHPSPVDGTAPATEDGPGSAHHATGRPPSSPLRPGESFLDLAMPAAYAPRAPAPPGTDDYRCFLLDPELEEDAFVTGVDVVPGREDLVHHVILFRVGPDQVGAVEQQDAAEDGPGWTCFGGAGAGGGGVDSLDRAPWVGAWAPGGGERLLADDVGIPLEAGGAVIMQVHYNLLAGSGEDVSSARLRVVPGTADLDPLETMLLPAPVEMPCRPGHEGPLCDREDALLDVMARFGQDSGRTAAGLQLLCDGSWTAPVASPTQSCDRTVREPLTVRAAAGHMHLLGRSISLELNPGTDRARTLLDVPVYDFDDQGAQALAEPVEVVPGDVVRVTCHHDQAARDMLPAFAGQPDRYVVWGEGTTDEMCLGILMVTRPPTP